MRSRLTALALVAVGGCQCLQPVDECALTTCDAGIGGGIGGGSTAGGAGGGVFEDLASCVQCGCDTSKFTNVPPLGAPLHPQSFCDEVQAITSIPSLLAVALPGYDADAGCRPDRGVDSNCLLWRGQVGEVGYARACAATLVPRVTEVRCLLLAP